MGFELMLRFFFLFKIGLLSVVNHANWVASGCLIDGENKLSLSIILKRIKSRLLVVGNHLCTSLKKPPIQSLL